MNRKPSSRSWQRLAVWAVLIAGISLYVLPAQASAPAVPAACEVSPWTAWTPCSALKTQQRTRTVVKKPAKDGEECPELLETRECVPAKPVVSAPTAAPVDCQVSAFGAWSVCSSASNGTQKRVRTITKLPANGGKACPVLVQVQPCGVLQ